MGEKVNAIELIRYRWRREEKKKGTQRRGTPITGRWKKVLGRGGGNSGRKRSKKRLSGNGSFKNTHHN